MCGIAGILNLKDSEKQVTAIQRMTDRIAHRGPDAEGLYVNEKIALGHRRLSIIDLSESANQPMWDSTGRYVIVYNGEIYNYKEVKSQVTDYYFRTNSDSEVILAAYTAWGVKCLDRLNGMFAFALWDTVEEQLFVARDRVGKKPFYYAFTERHLVFGSEQRSVLASGLIARQLNTDRLAEYLMYQAAMGEHTLVSGVQQLEAGHYAIITNGKIKSESYWSYDHSKGEGDSYAVAKEKVKDLFIDAVRLRMVSDVPIGAFLSGGIDSSLVVACMAELSEAPVNTFTVSFVEKEYDESVFAQQIATKYKTNHHRMLVKPEEFLNSVEDILASMDMPSGDGPNSYLVAKHTREAGVKVAMSGLGGDELFAGYNKFMIYQRVMKHRWILQFPKAMRGAIASLIIASGKNQQTLKLGFLLGLNKWDLSTVYPVLRRAHRFDEAQILLAKGTPSDSVEERLRAMSPSIARFEHFSQCTVGEMETYTRDILLRDTDQMSMAHALEVRVPFFDYRLIEYVLSLSDEVKYPHTPKKLLVEALAPRLPVEIFQRRKMGFTLPMAHWLKNELAEMTDTKLQYLSSRDEFNGAAIMNQWTSFKQGDKRVVWSQIWKLVVLSDWMERNGL